MSGGCVEIIALPRDPISRTDYTQRLPSRFYAELYKGQRAVSPREKDPVRGVQRKY